MFAKPAHFKPLTAIKGSERKRVLSEVVDQLKLSSDDNEQRNKLLPKNSQTAKAIVHSGERIQIYSDDSGRPLWILVRDSKYVPTVYTVAKDATILPTVRTVRNTLEFLQNGADFMIPGIFGARPNAKKGTVVQIRTIAEHGDLLLAVGIALVDLSDTSLTQGKGVQVLNVVGDTLTPDKSTLKMSSASSEEHAKTVAESAVPAVPAVGSTNKDTSTVPEPVTQPAAPVAEEVSAPVDQVDNVTIHSDTEDNGDGELSVEDIDSAFEYALSKALLTPDLSYPLPMATIAQLMGDNLPYSHPSLLIKKTSWKKVAKMLKWAAKKGLLEVKERQGGEVVVLSSKIEATDPVSAPASSGIKKQKSPRDRKGKLDAKQLYKPKSMLKPLLPADAPSGAYYSGPELRELLTQYLKEKALERGRDVSVSEELRKALGLKQDVTQLRRDEVVAKALANCNVFHVIYSPGDASDSQNQAPRKGPIPTIKMKLEKRGGNKVVTLVSGVEKFGFECKKLAEKLRVVCAGSTAVNKIQGVEQIVVQGDHMAKIAQYLEGEGLKSSWISRA